MRFCDLKGLMDEVAGDLIWKCPIVEMEKILENPEQFVGKIFVFCGNYDGFDTNRLCARTFEFLVTEGKWRVSDMIIHDMSGSHFEHHFSKRELESNFEKFCNSQGFLMDA